MGFDTHQHVSEAVELVCLLLEKDRVVFLITLMGCLVYGVIHRSLKSTDNSSEVPVL